MHRDRQNAAGLGQQPFADGNHSGLLSECIISASVPAFPSLRIRSSVPPASKAADISYILDAIGHLADMARHK